MHRQLNNQVGYHDLQAKVGRHGKTYNLGYKLHLATDSKTMLPLAGIVVSANQNEKKQSFSLVAKTKAVLAKSNVKLRSIITDSQYSDQKKRCCSKISHPYPAHHKRAILSLLRVDIKSRIYDQKAK
jgi:TPP-dependent trihydroxycyclohexane-1,2-dione (THcHDO) dehydratase